MRVFLTLLKRELSAIFWSPIAYVVATIFLFICGLGFIVQIYQYNETDDPNLRDVTLLQSFFGNGFFWFVLIPMFSLITMRLFSEEYKLKTIEPLLTAPVRDWQVLLSKFFGALIFYGLLYAPVFSYFYIIWEVAGVSAVESRAAFWGSYLFLLSSGSIFIAAGCFASALTRNQVVAAIGSFCFSIIIVLGGYLFLSLQPEVAARNIELLVYFVMTEHIYDFSRGIIDTRPLIFYSSVTAFFLFCAYQAFQYRRWRT